MSFRLVPSVLASVLVGLFVSTAPAAMFPLTPGTSDVSSLSVEYDYIASESAHNGYGYLVATGFSEAIDGNSLTLGDFLLKAVIDHSTATPTVISSNLFVTGNVVQPDEVETVYSSANLIGWRIYDAAFHLAYTQQATGAIVPENAEVGVILSIPSGFSFNSDFRSSGNTATADAFAIAAVPEPATLGCLGLGLMALALRRRVR